MNPLVSVIIPAYGCMNHIHRALDSVLAQGREDLEVIVVNDCSPDDLDAAMAPYLPDPRVVFKTCQESASLAERCLGKPFCQTAVKAVPDVRSRLHGRS